MILKENLLVLIPRLAELLSGAEDLPVDRLGPLNIQINALRSKNNIMMIFLTIFIKKQLSHPTFSN